MTAKVSILGIVTGIFLSTVAPADVVRFTGGRHFQGEVVSFNDGVFQVKITSDAVTNFPASAVAGIDLEHGHVSATLETKSEGTITGKLWLLDKQRFSLEDSSGLTRYIGFSKVASATFNYVSEPVKPRPVPVQSAATSAVPTKRSTTEPDIATIARGERVSLPQQLARGKITIIDFAAQWCKPCWAMGAILKSIASEDADVAVRTVDIVRWHSPVADQYQITAIPRVLVYDADGTLVRTLTAPDEKSLREAIEKARPSLPR